MSGFLSLGPLAFANPLLLLALIGLPILWWLLRATPPAPMRERFPGVAILLGLERPEKTPMRTPWWLLLLRLIIAALVILAFAEPLLNPRDRLAAGQGPVRLVVDAGWASAPDWEARMDAARDTLDQAGRSGRAVTLILPGMTDDRPLETRAAEDWRGVLDTLAPAPWAPERAAAVLPESAAGETVWIHDGLDHGEAAAFAEALAALGPLRAIGPEQTARALVAGREDGALTGTVLRADQGVEAQAGVLAYAAAEAGAGRNTAGAAATFEAEETRATARFDAPLEVLNAVGLLALEDGRSAAGAVILDDSFRRKRLGVISGERAQTDQVLLSGRHYLREATRNDVELRETTLPSLLEDDARALSALDALAMIDIGALTQAEIEALTAWVEAGGTLIRFAGPALAAATSERAGFARAEDPLLPVRLRPGGRDLGGAMSWGEPQRIAPFEANSPFHGLPTPDDATVARQVLAQPDVDLPARTWARLRDGSPLVTADARGEGRVVLFHVGADPRWSSLPLSGLFPAMIERVIDRAAGIGGANAAPELLDAPWAPVALLDGFGTLSPAPQGARSVTGARLADGGAGPDAPPGLYEARETRVALNVMAPDASLSPLPPLPAGTVVSTLGTRAESALKPLLLAAALVLLALDAIAALWATGKLRRPVAAALLVLLAVPPAKALDDKAMRAALDGSIGYILTGDADVDRISQAGLYGLGRVLTERTSVEPAVPVGVDLEVDELAVYPLLYWPTTAAQPTPSQPAQARLNDYLRHGGMILFDTRDQHLAIGGSETPGQRELRRLAAGLDLPPLAPVDPAHVLTRSFYLIDDFPGRHEGGAVWVEAVPTRDELEDALEKGFSNDGVSPVIVGGRDWSGAWALDENGRPLLPVSGGATQREMAFRFGVNLVMYAYTGSYKSDQVHVPALLERLGR